MSDRIRYVLEVDDQGSPRLVRFGQTAQRTGQQAQTAFNNTSNASRGLSGNLAKLSIAGLAVSQALSMAARGGMAIVDAAAKYDSLQMRLKGIEGGAKGASLAFEKLQALSKLSGLGFEQAADAYAGLRSLKQDGPEAIAIIEGIARANATMGGGAEEFGRAMRQIQQIIGKGKLMAEDVGAIAESIPNFRAMLLEAFGTTDAAAINAKYSMDEFLAGIVRASKTLPEPSETIANNLDNLNDAWTRLKASFADSDAIKSATASLAKMLETLAKANEETNRAEKQNEQFGYGPGVVGRLRSGNSGVLKEAGRLSVDAILGLATGGLLLSSGLRGGPSLGRYVPGLGMRTADDQAKAIGLSGTETSQSSAAASFADWMKGKETSSSEKMSDKKGKTGIKGRDVNVDFWDTGADLGATQYEWNQRRGVDRALSERRKADRQKEMEELQAIGEQEIAAYKEVSAVLEQIAQERTDRINGYIVDIAQNTSSVLANSFAQIGDGFQAMADSMLAGFKNMLAQMAAELAANAVVFGVLNLFSGGAASTFAKGFGGLSGLILGHATGGSVGGGETSIVGERRAELFVPRSSGRVEPVASSGPGITIIVRNPAEAQSTARALRKDARQRNTGLY